MSEHTSRLRPRALRRKRPPQWRQVNFPTRGFLKLSPNPRKPMRERARDAWERIRLIIRSATLYSLLTAWMIVWESYVAALIFAMLALVMLVFRPYIHEVSMRLEEDFGTDSAEFLSTVAGATGVPLIAGNRVEILQNGDAIYPAMLADISRARHSITMEQYIFSAGETGREFAKAMAARSRDGVSVKILLDAVGGASIGREIIRILAEAGCELRWFHPVRWYNLHRVNNRNHRKSLVIDGSIGYTGGAGIDDHWRGDARTSTEWRDIQIRVAGPGAVPLQTGFAQNWLATTGEVITGPEYYPVLDLTGGVEVQTVHSSPRGDIYAASILYSLCILSARKHIYIGNPYFVPGPRIIDMLADAGERGVDVKVMVAGSQSDTWWARQNSIRLYGKLLEAGVEIYEYQPTMLHYKMMVVDHIWATVGTANLDHRSFRLNEETNLCFFDPDLVDDLRKTFFTDLEKCTRVELKAWRNRGAMTKAGELFASLLRDQV